MDAREVRESVMKPKLTEVFGAAMAAGLINQAMSAAIGKDSEQARLQASVDAICNDARVVGMWGVSTAAKLKAEWMAKL